MKKNTHTHTHRKNILYTVRTHYNKHNATPSDCSVHIFRKVRDHIAPHIVSIRDVSDGGKGREEDKQNRKGDNHHVLKSRRRSVIKLFVHWQNAHLEHNCESHGGEEGHGPRLHAEQANSITARGNKVRYQHEKYVCCGRVRWVRRVCGIVKNTTAVEWVNHNHI